MRHPYITKYKRPSEQSMDEMVSNAPTDKDFNDASSANSTEDQNLDQNRGVYNSDDLVKEWRIGIWGNIVQLLPGFISIINPRPASTVNFRYLMKLQTTRVFWANGLTPNAVLSGTRGDICINGDGGKVYVCTTTGTTWTSLL